MLEVRNLSKIYKIGKNSKAGSVVALNNVSITFPEKGLIFLLGKSGSGKSTLLNSIGGLDTFDSGEIIIKGKSSKNFSQSDFDSYRNTFIGFIFQEYNVLEEFSVAKNLGLALELQGKNPSKENVEELLRMVDMMEFAKRKPNQLSGGQKQRVAIARALIKNPEIIMADEPTGALDSNTGKQVMETLKKLSAEKLVIIVSHDREFAEIYGDRIIELKDGQIISDVTKKEVEAQKTASGISVIDGEMIHIRKGQQITREDLNALCMAIIDNSKTGDTIISLSDKANEDIKKANSITDEGNKEVFMSTTPEDVSVKAYNPSDFKLIRSTLKFKDSFKMGASALKNKVGKLVFTIFLSFIAFAMFGLIDTFSSFNRGKAIANTVAVNQDKYVSMLKEKKGEYSNDAYLYNEEDLKLINEKFPDITLKPVVGANVRVGEGYYADTYGKTFSISGLETPSNSILKTAFYSGMVHMADENELAKYGLALVCGRLPNQKNEVCLSKRNFEVLKSQNLDKNLTPELMLSTYNSLYFYNYNYNGSGDNYFTIVGIVDDGKDWSQYESLSTEELSANYMLQSKISRELNFGFSHMLFVNKGVYDDYVNSKRDMYLNLFKEDTQLNNINARSFKILDGEYNNYCYQTVVGFSSVFTYRGGSILSGTLESPFVDLKDDCIILPSNEFSYLFNSYDYEEKKSLLNGQTPLTIQLKGRIGDADEMEDIKTYTVVGYYDTYYDFYNPIVSSKTSEEIESYKSMYSELKLYNASNCSSISSCETFEESYDLYISDYAQPPTLSNFVNDKLQIEYLKNGASAIQENELFKLKDDEIMLPSSYLYNLGSGQELYDMIDAGLVIRFCFDWEGESEICSFKVAGVTSGWDNVYLSNVGLQKLCDDYLTGYDYVIANLSDNVLINNDFINFCEKFGDNNIKYTVQMGATVILDQFEDIFNTLTEVFFWVGVGFAVFAGLLLMNFISTSISYKKREIGILRALGARGSDVFGIFFNESLIIAMINFVLATATTIVTCLILNGLIMNKLGLDLVILSVGIRQIVLMLGISVLVAFLASFLPVMKIAKKKPIDAINNR